MKHELRRIEPLRAANVSALVYGILMTIMSLVMAPFFLLLAALAPQPQGGGPASAFIPLILVIFYPIFGLVFGWISGLLSSFIYNLVVKWVGGIVVEVAASPAEIGTGMA